MQPIEFYTDYRQYLRDYYINQKEHYSDFSYRAFCRKANLKSPSLYPEVIARKRNLSPATINAFIKGLGLNERDGRFFEHLVLFNQAKDEESKKKFLAILRGLRYRKPQKIIPVHLYEYYEKWYHPVIRELAVAMKWNDNYSLLARAVNPPLKISEARESIDLLLTLGFLKKNAHGDYYQTDSDITTGPEINSIAVRTINREYARLGQHAIDRFLPSQRDISSIIMAIPRSRLPEFKREIMAFRKKIIALTGKTPEKIDDVYAMVVEFFPVGHSSPPEELENGKTI